MTNTPISTYLLIKLASRCNLACTYCYWFRDEGVYRTPKLMTEIVEDALIERLATHIIRYGLKSFNCIFHGGEPLLFGIDRFKKLIGKMEIVGKSTDCVMEYSITTNGVLINEEWSAIFKYHSVRVAVSIDGTASVHDNFRKKINGRGSHSAAVRGYQLLKQIGLQPNIIAVCDPKSDPEATLKFLIEDLECVNLDVLPPDLNHNDDIVSIAQYYKTLFDIWYDKYSDSGIKVRFLHSLIRSVLGLETNSDSFGYGPLHTISLSTDGALEPNDVLRIGGSERTKTNANILRSDLDEVAAEKNWIEAYNSALKLCSKCENCKYNFACGGGHLSHRWSDNNAYDNPSVYCDDLMLLFDHVWNRVSADILISDGTRQITLSQFLKKSQNTI